MVDRSRRLRSDDEGAAFLEFTLFAGVFFTILFGIIEFSLAFYQWNAATKAVQIGARLAAVSNPVAAELKTLTGPGGGADPTDPMPAFSAVCNGQTQQCACTYNGSGLNCTYDSAAMETLVYGRGNNGAKCNRAPNIGMCSLFSRVTPSNVVVEYRHTGLGYAGRPAVEYTTGQFSAHVVPTISVAIGEPAEPIPFQFYFLSGLLGFGDVPIPGLLSTFTGEDLAGQ